MPVVEQNKLKRSGLGVRAYDRDRAFAGVTLFTPISGDGTIYLIDLYGEVIHTWKMPYPAGMYGYLTERGTVFYNGKTTENATRYISTMGTASSGSSSRRNKAPERERVADMSRFGA